MSGNNPLRKDKTCLNCRHVVEQRFCPNCGQENTHTRKSFHHLFVHFFEDLTHYENAFWKTIRHLLFKPGRLTKEYLSGKRLSYLAPVRLYIFISFVTFFLLAILPETPSDDSNPHKVEKKNGNKDIESLDSMNIGYGEARQKKKGKTNLYQGVGRFKSVAQLDSFQRAQPAAKKLTRWPYYREHKLAEMREKSETEGFQERFLEGVAHNIPKALFLYMPLFAFWLWVVHDKKKWFYFDHGIFTLHYFSFLLLSLLLLSLLSEAMGFSSLEIFDYIEPLLWISLFGWWFFYFFRSHSNFYGEPKAVSRLKGLLLYFINMVILSFFTVGLLIYTMLYVH